MAEALWASGGSYDAAEDRKLIRAIFYHAGGGGVIRGMQLTPGTGLNVVVGAGYFVLDDSSFGSYLGYLATSQTVSILGNTSGSPRVDQIYAAIDATSGAVTLNKTGGAGTIQLGTVTVPNGAASLVQANMASVPLAVDMGGFSNARYLRRDQADTLFAGTNAYTPTNANNVATKGYVDDRTGFTNVYGPGFAHSGQGVPSPAQRFLIQAGTFVAYSNGASLVGMYWPRPFPTGCLSVVATGGDDHSNPGWTFNSYASDAAGFSYRALNSLGAPQPGSIHRINYIAIGW